MLKHTIEGNSEQQLIWNLTVGSDGSLTLHVRDSKPNSSHTGRYSVISITKTGSLVRHGSIAKELGLQIDGDGKITT